ncbi:hypothetical protein [Curtobacterium sp. 1544]|uniref:hypothetical protein n=1 Tax=Curtobacterium sp. 1544 TaxID=3156417 RepID=UPI00339B9B10
MSMRTSIIGGDSAHRGLFGGRISKPRLWALGSSVVLTLVLVFVIGLWALLIGVVLIGAAWFATIDTANNTILRRRMKDARWKERLRRGTTKFVPYDQDGWDMLTDRWAEASTREEKRESMQELHAMRDTPDGVSGMVWLQDGVGEPGIQWHQTPEGEEYLAVTFTTTGQVTGIETDQVFDVASAGFSAVVASLGDPLGFAKRIQTISRNMPTDSAQHEAWMAENGDNSVPAVLLHSYKDVVDGVAAAAVDVDAARSEPTTAPPMACAAQRRQGARAQRASPPHPHPVVRAVGAIGEDGSMTTVRGTIRSTDTITADGHADDQSTARARAVDGLELAGYVVMQTNTVSSTAAGNITVRAVARSTEIQPSGAELRRRPEGLPAVGPRRLDQPRHHRRRLTPTRDETAWQSTQRSCSPAMGTSAAQESP